MRNCSFPLLYKEDSRLQILAKALQAEKANSFQLLGLCGSLPSIVLATLYKSISSQGKHLIILPNEEALTTLERELERLLSSDVFYKLLETSDLPSNLLTRSQALSALYDKESAWLLTTSSALCSLVPKSGRAKRARLHLKKEDTLDRSLFFEKIEALGFTSCEEVYEPGTYAIRSSRFDIYSYAHKKPLRISLWGDTISRISFFETESQLSYEEINNAELLAVPDLSLPYNEQVALLQQLPQKLCLWWMCPSSTHLPTSDETIKRPVESYFSQLSTNIL